MPKVLRILNRFNVGGPVFNAAYLTKYLPKEYESKLIGGVNDDSEANSLYVTQSLDLEVQLISSMRREVSIKNDRQAYLEIKKVIKEFKPDIVHTHASKAGAIGRLAAHKMKVPVIVHTFHGHVFDGYFGKTKTSLFKKIEKYLAKKTDAIVAISEDQKYDLTEIHNIVETSKVHVIPLGLDLDRFSEMQEYKRKAFRLPNEIADDVLAIGIIGRLAPIKNHSMFIHAIAYLKIHSDKKIQAFIIGDGEEKRSIKEEAAILGLSYDDRSNPNVDIIFTSWVRDMDYPMNGLDIICMTSISEGTPVSLIEAQAAGRPIVATKAGSTQQVVLENETALLCGIHDNTTFYTNLLSLVQDDELRSSMTMKGVQFVKEKFHYKRLVKDMDELYKQLLQKKKK